MVETEDERRVGRSTGAPRRRHANKSRLNNYYHSDNTLCLSPIGGNMRPFRLGRDTWTQPSMVKSPETQYPPRTCFGNCKRKDYLEMVPVLDAPYWLESV